MRIGILYGGKSGEHEVSLRSAASIVRNLSPDKYDPILIGISKKGTFYLQADSVLQNARTSESPLELYEQEEALVSVIPGKGFFVKDRNMNLDFVFPIVHGTFGEDGTMQGLLEMADIPYAGASVLGSAVGMEKILAKQIWEQQGLPVVPFFSVTPEQASDPAFTNLEARVKKEFSYPVFVKPSRAGSSVGVSKAGTPEELQKALETAFQYDTVCLVEPAVKGREIECSVTGNQDAVSYAIGEILPSHEFYDYEAKYIDPDGAGLVIPADISEDTKRGVKEIAEKAYKSIYSQGYARVDFFIEQESNRILLNEINTIPGFTSISMFPMLCSENGLGYSSLLDLLIQLGIERYELRKGLQYGV